MLYEMRIVSYTEEAEAEEADFLKTLITSLFFAPSSSSVHRLCVMGLDRRFFAN